MKKERIGWIFAMLLLISALVVSIFLGVTGYFSSLVYLNSNSDLVVGDQVTIAVKANSAHVASFTFDGSYLPNETIPHTIQIQSMDLEKDVNVRVKALIFGLGEEVPFDFVTTSHFEKEPDGYYYFDEVLNGGNKITFSNYIVIPSQQQFVSGEKYVLTIVVETVETEYMESIWKN